MAFQLPKGDPDKSLEVLGELPDDIPEKETLLIEQRLRRIYGRVSQLPRKRPEVPVTNKHPDDPRIFSAVRELDICWSFGIEPLATQIYINARGHRNKVNAEKRAANEKVPDPKSDPHRHILDDFEKDNSKLVSWHIASVDRRVITALIRGDIAVQEHNDPEFAGLIYDNHRLQFRPGTYINVVARRQRVDGQEQPYVGRGLSYNEWSETFDSFKDYLKFDNDATTQSNAWAQKVDQMYPLWTLENQQLQHHRDERRYCKNSSQETQLREFIEIGEKVWLRPLKAIWLQDPKDPHLDIPYARCPIESGWAIYVADRGHGHVTQKATNYLLGLFLAILKALWGERANKMLLVSARPQPRPSWVVQIFADVEDGNLALNLRQAFDSRGEATLFGIDIDKENPRAGRNHRLRQGRKARRQRLGAERAQRAQTENETEKSDAENADDQGQETNDSTQNGESPQNDLPFRPKGPTSAPK